MMTIHPYQPSQFDEFDDFVVHSNNGTIFHTQRFLSYHSDGKFDFHVLMFYEDSKLVAVLPAALREGGISLESPIGSSYGGIVLAPMPYKKHEQIVDALLEYCADKGFQKIFLTPAPFFYQREQMQNIDYALALRGFDFDRHYISHIIEHGQNPQFLSTFNATARNYVRQFNKNQNLTIEFTTHTDAYYEIYPILVENKAKHDAHPTHSLDEMVKLQSLFPQNMQLVIARLNRKAIAASWIMDCNAQVTLCFYNMMLYEFEKFNPMYGIMNAIVDYSQSRGASFVDIGVSQDTKHINPMTPSYPLIDFKEKFGAKGMLRSTFRKIL